MKKSLFILAMGCTMCISSYAQEEDVTHYIQNAGFDEDLTFQANGKMKDAVSTTTSLSDRSWAYIAADSTVYARPKSTSSQSRPDGRKMEAVNGFKGRVKGWTLESNAEFPKCEWTYFGSVAYDLGETAVPIADDGNTYLTVPARPTNEFDGGEGFVYLRAGWTNSAIYKQVVKLPCAKYRLEYWTININPNTTAVAKDLTQIVCRKDVFKDEAGTGLSAQVWTKHEFEFTPTAEFTMQFGYEAANAGSGGQPIVGLDGIKLYKIDDADRDEINMADIYDMADECQTLSGEAATLGASALAGYISDYGMELEEIDLTGEELEAAVKVADARMAQIREAIAQVEKVVAMLEKMDNLMKEKDFPGKDAFQTAYQKILGYIEGTGTPVEGEDIVAEILGAAEEANAAIKAYYMSQMGTASETNPADFTVFVNHNWFIKDEYAPVFEDGSWVFPHADEGGYADGLSNDDFSSEGWTVTGTYTGGDQRLSYKFGYPCWNAWGSGINGTIAVGQTIEGLPNGYYTVSAMIVTQSGCLTDQHVYAESSTEKKISAPLTSEGWDNGEWETVAMTAEQKVLVVDGKLTIGAEGTGTGSGSAGWFCATNFQLNFLGKATDAEINTAITNVYAEKVPEAKAFARTMHFKGDKNNFNALISEYENVSIEHKLEAIQAINGAMESAQLSEAKYREYFPEDEYLVDGYIMREVAERLSYNSYGTATDIARFAYNYVMDWMNRDDAYYWDFDAVINLLNNYVNYYIPYYQQAEELTWESSETGKAALESVMERQKTVLTSGMQSRDIIDAYIVELKNVMLNVNKQNIWENDKNATDYTAFINNPNAEAVDGWTFVMGNGDGNGEKIGQWYDGSRTRYFDSYNGYGLADFNMSQLVTGLPNGTYKVGAYVRTPAEGAYIYAGDATGTKFVEIPLSYYNTVSETSGEDTLVVASDKWGPIWEEAKAIMESYEYNNLSWEEQERIDNIYNANNGEGRGWKYMEIANVYVTNHQLLIGAACGSETLGTEKVFAGNWFSVGGWTLTQTAKGDNSNWEGPMSDDLNENNMLYIAEGTKLAKTNMSYIPVSLKNTDDIMGFQLDVVLPEGMTIANGASYLDDNRSYSHQISYNQQSDGSIRMIVSSWDNEIFSYNDGVVLNIGVNIPSYMSMGDYAVTLKNVIMTNSYMKTIKCTDKTFVVSLSGIYGDVNSDEQVNVTDVVMMIDYILERYPQGFNTAMADVTGDGEINITDVVTVIDVILGRTVISRSAAATDHVGQLGIQRQLNMVAGETTAVPVSLTNLTTYSAFQMDVTLPAGLSLEKVAFTERAAKSHQLTYSKIADGKYRIVGFSLQNEGFNGESGDLLQLSVKSDGSSFESGMHIDEITFVTPKGTAHNLMAVDVLGEVTGIATLNANGEKGKKVYDLQGRQVEKTTKGLYIVNGKKSVKK